MDLKSREELVNEIFKLNREVVYLKTQLMRFQLLTNCYEKYIHFLQLIKDKNITNNSIFLEENVLKQQLIVLKNHKLNIEENNQQIEMIAIIDSNNDISSDIQNNEKQMTNNTEVCIEDNKVNDSLLLNTCIQNSETKVNSKQIFEPKSSERHNNNNRVIKTYKKKSNIVNDSTDNTLNTNEFKCDINDCKYTTNSKTSLDLHNRKVHIKPYFCQLCDNKFGSKASLIRHMNGEHKGVKPYICFEDNCNESFHSLIELRKHKKIHKYKDNIVICGYSGCDSVFQGLSCFKSLRKHQLLKHKELMVEKVDKINSNESLDSIRPEVVSKTAKRRRNKYIFKVICGYKGCETSYSGFRSLETLHSHRLSKHPELFTDLKSIKPKTNKSSPVISLCGHNGCQMTYNSSNSLMSHKLRKHPELFPNSKTYACDKNGCEFSTKDKTRFNYHMEGHEGIRRYICEVCGKTSVREYQHKYHMKLHSGVRIVCDWKDCNKSFARRYLLYKHQLRHKGIKIFVCDWNNCGKKFYCTQELKDHMNGHTGHKPYPCLWPECGKTFSSSRSLSLHMRIHTNDK